jgi:hypothetical protein
MPASITILLYSTAIWVRYAFMLWSRSRISVSLPQMNADVELLFCHSHILCLSAAPLLRAHGSFHIRLFLFPFLERTGVLAAHCDACFLDKLV